MNLNMNIINSSTKAGDSLDVLSQHHLLYFVVGKVLHLFISPIRDTSYVNTLAFVSLSFPRLLRAAIPFQPIETVPVFSSVTVGLPALWTFRCTFKDSRQLNSVLHAVQWWGLWACRCCWALFDSFKLSTQYTDACPPCLISLVFF